MFSSLPKLADRAFIVGFLVPTAAFLLAIFASLGPADGGGVSVLLGEAKSFEDLTVAVAGLWFGALGLMLLNRTIYRLAEGYAWPLDSQARTDRAKTRWRAADARIQALYDSAKASGDDALASQWRGVKRLFLQQYPPTVGRVLPTRFGNANRAFESYSQEVYGVDSIIIWPRLSGVISKDMQSVLADARSQVDCFLNLCFLAICYAAFELGVVLYRVGSQFGPSQTADGPIRALITGVTDAWPALVMAVVGGLASRLFYNLAIERAMALGEHVKAAFDLFLPALPAALGYDPPQPRKAREAFWLSLENTYSFFRQAPETYMVKPPARPPAGGAPGPDEPDDLEGGEP